MEYVFSFFNPFNCLNWSMGKRDSMPDESINSLPEEVVIHIFSFLSVRELGAAEQVCRQWRRLGEEDTLWKRHHCKFFDPKPIGYGSLEDKPYSFKKSYLVHSKSKAKEIYLSLHKTVTDSEELREWWTEYKKKGGLQSQFKRDPGEWKEFVRETKKSLRKGLRG